MREIDGIGFKTADMIAINIGIPNESPERIRAGILHCLSESEEAGDTCALFGELVSKTSALTEVDSQKCAAEISALVEEGSLKKVGEGMLQSPQLDYAERKIATSLKRILETPSELPPIKFEAAAQWANDRRRSTSRRSRHARLWRLCATKYRSSRAGRGRAKLRFYARFATFSK